MPETIGFIGLGHMGLPMAQRLQSAGFALRVYNRSPEKAKPLVEKGATVAKSPPEVATPGGIVVTMLADDKALEAVATDELARALGQGGVHVSMSTVSPATNAKLAEGFVRYGAAVVAAPVFGRPEAAGAGKLWICTSGPQSPKQRVKPVFDALGQAVFDFGETVGSANVVKLAGNFMLTAAIEAMAEASAMAEKNGVPREQLLKMLTQSLFNCQVYNGYAARIIDADFEKVGFGPSTGIKGHGPCPPNRHRHARTDAVPEHPVRSLRFGDRQRPLKVRRSRPGAGCGGRCGAQVVSGMATQK